MTTRLRPHLRRIKFALLSVIEFGWALGVAVAGRFVRPRVQRWSSPSGLRVLVIAPHPDDEMAGCAGTLVLHKCSGDSVCVAHITDGRQSRAMGLGPEAMALRRAQEARAAAEALGIEYLELFGLPEGGSRRCMKGVYRHQLHDRFGTRRPNLYIVWVILSQSNNDCSL